MSNPKRCLLTTKDYSTLERLLERSIARNDALVPMIRDKLSHATVVFRDDIDPRAVTLNSRVVFRVDDGPSDIRILVHGEDNGFVGMTIPITIPRGLALLGLVEDQEAIIEGLGGPPERIRVEEVAYQPEAARRGTPGRGQGVAWPGAAASVVDFGARRGSASRPTRPTFDPDDDGPSAA